MLKQNTQLQNMPAVMMDQPLNHIN